MSIARIEENALDGSDQETAAVVSQLFDARLSLASSGVDALIALRAWCDVVAEAAKQRALRTVAIEAGETRVRAEFRLGKLLRGGAGAGMPIKSRDALVALSELSDDQFEAALADMRLRRKGDQILQFRPDSVLRKAVRLSRREVEPGIFVDFRGLYNGCDTIVEARHQVRQAELEALRWRRFTEQWSLRAERRKPENVKLDEAYTRARRLAQTVERMAEHDFGGHRARSDLSRAEALLGQAAEALHRALQSAVLGEDE